MRVCLGGTFHPFHRGHEALLAAAVEDGESVFVGITDGALASRGSRKVPSWEERARIVEIFCASWGFDGELVMAPLHDGVGPAVSGDYDAIVVSEETVEGAQAINDQRRAQGKRPLEVRVVPYRRGQDLLPISGTRVAAGDIDRDGQRLKPLRVAIGSANPVKVAAVEACFAQIFHVPIHERGIDVDSGVPEQPKGDETLAGARNRARAALDAWPEAEYAVGVEAGLSQDPAGTAWYDVQACVVRDRTGHETDGWGPAFQYPSWVTQRALEGEMVSHILGPVADDPRIGGTTGAIGFLTDGRMDRTELTRIAALMAMVPRLRPELAAEPA